MLGGNPIVRRLFSIAMAVRQAFASNSLRSAALSARNRTISWFSIADASLTD
jgi:hypothetical protein